MLNRFFCLSSRCSGRCWEPWQGLWPVGSHERVAPGARGGATVHWVLVTAVPWQLWGGGFPCRQLPAPVTLPRSQETCVHLQTSALGVPLRAGGKSLCFRVSHQKRLTSSCFPGVLGRRGQDSSSGGKDAQVERHCFKASAPQVRTETKGKHKQVQDPSIWPRDVTQW